MFMADNFEDRLKALAEQISRSLSDVDVDDVADRLGIDPERARGLAGAAERWLSDHRTGGEPLFSDRNRAAGRPEDPRPDVGRPDLGASPGPPAGDRATPPGPHPLDQPTDDQGRILSALDSGRWTVRPGSSRLAATGVGPEPPHAGAGPSDLVNELRARDWITADGAVTLVGRQALLRWCHTADGAVAPKTPAAASKSPAAAPRADSAPSAADDV